MNEVITDNQSKDIIRTFEIADSLYESIVDRCELKGGDLSRAALIGELKRETQQQLVLSIWKYMTKKQAEHFRDFQKQEFKVHPERSHEAILIEFALFYPDLMDKVYADLAYFFVEFVVEFNEIRS